MDKTLNRSQLEAQLSGKSESISRRLTALQQEVDGLSVRRMIDEKPWIGVAAAILGGLLIGLVFGGKKHASGRSAARGTSSLVQGYVDAIEEDVRRLTDSGEEVSEAVARVLRERTPLVVYAQDESGKTKGVIGLATGLIFKQAFGAAVKAALAYAGADRNGAASKPRADTMPESSRRAGE